MLLTLREYERIYKVINTLLLNEGGDPANSCIMFSAFGGYILKKHYKIKAEIKAGLAAYHVGAGNDAIVFGELDEKGSLTGNNDSFHCWIEAKGWLIDFMAPTFPEIHRKFEGNYSIPSNMLQKPLSKMSPSVNDLEKAGDFYLESSPVTLQEKMSIFLSSPAYSDLAEVCVQTFRKPPKKMMKEIIIKDQNGRDMSTSLIGNTVVGAW